MDIVFVIRFKHPEAPTPLKLRDSLNYRLLHKWTYKLEVFGGRLPLTGEFVSLPLHPLPILPLSKQQSREFKIIKTVWEPEQQSITYEIEFDDFAASLIKNISLDDWQAYCESASKR